MLSASSSPANDDEKPPLNFDDDFDKGCVVSELAAGSVRRGLHSNADSFTMVMDSGVSDHFV